MNTKQTTPHKEFLTNNSPELRQLIVITVLGSSIIGYIAGVLMCNFFHGIPFGFMLGALTFLGTLSFILLILVLFFPMVKDTEYKQKVAASSDTNITNEQAKDNQARAPSNNTSAQDSLNSTKTHDGIISTAHENDAKPPIATKESKALSVQKILRGINTLENAEIAKLNLSEHEKTVSPYLLGDCTYEEIGQKLFISTSTVKFHARNIYRKAHVNSRVAFKRLIRRRIQIPYDPDDIM